MCPDAGSVRQYDLSLCICLTMSLSLVPVLTVLLPLDLPFVVAVLSIVRALHISIPCR